MLEGELAAVQGSSGLRTQTFGLHYSSGAPGALEAALHALCADAEAAVRNGCEARPMLQDLMPLEHCYWKASTCLYKCTVILSQRTYGGTCGPAHAQ